MVLAEFIQSSYPRLHALNACALAAKMSRKTGLLLIVGRSALRPFRNEEKDIRCFM